MYAIFAYIEPDFNHPNVGKYVSPNCRVWVWYYGVPTNHPGLLTGMRRPPPGSRIARRLEPSNPCNVKDLILTLHR